jgi:hypothetical protein
MTEQLDTPTTSWMRRRREQRQTKRALKGDSPERLAEHHEPKRDWVDRMLWSGGVQRRSRF